MKKAPVLKYEKIMTVGKHGWWSEDLKDLVKDQRDADHKHYQGIIKEIFEEIDKMPEIHAFPIFHNIIQSLKSKYQEEK